MPNFKTAPSRPAIDQEVAVYHAMPHGLRDSLGRRIIPGAFVNTASVHANKRAALAAHESQKTWLDTSQGLDSYLRTMDEMSWAVGKMSGRFEHAEGWRRHLHLGFCSADANPLRDAANELSGQQALRATLGPGRVAVMAKLRDHKIFVMVPGAGFGRRVWGICLRSAGDVTAAFD